MESEAGRAESEAERVGAKAQRAESEAGRVESEAGRAESKAWRAESKAWRLESEARRVESGVGRAQASLQPMFELFTPKSAAPSLGPGRAMAPGQPQLPTGPIRRERQGCSWQMEACPHAHAACWREWATWHFQQCERETFSSLPLLRPNHEQPLREKTSKESYLPLMALL